MSAVSKDADGCSEQILRGIAPKSSLINRRCRASEGRVHPSYGRWIMDGRKWQRVMEMKTGCVPREGLEMGESGRDEVGVVNRYIRNSVRRITSTEWRRACTRGTQVGTKKWERWPSNIGATTIGTGETGPPTFRSGEPTMYWSPDFLAVVFKKQEISQQVPCRMQDLTSEFSKKIFRGWYPRTLTAEKVNPSRMHPTPSPAFGRARGASAPAWDPNLSPLNFSAVVAPLPSKVYSKDKKCIVV